MSCLLGLLLHFVQLCLVLTVFTSGILRGANALLHESATRRDRRSEFMRFGREVLVTSIQVRRRVRLITRRRVSGNRVRVVAGGTLLRTLFRRIRYVFQTPIPIILRRLVDLKVFLSVLGGLLIHNVGALCTPLVASRRGFRCIAKDLCCSFRGGVAVLLKLRSAFFRRNFLIQGGFMRDTLESAREYNGLVRHSAFCSVYYGWFCNNRGSAFPRFRP